MLKKYSSKSEIAINVALEGGKSLFISFSPLTVGGSVYYTRNKVIQEAVEKHPRYGKLFRLAATEEEAGDEPGKVVTDKGESDQMVREKVSVEATQVQVDGLDDAKDYLNVHFGTPRGELRSKKAILEAAETNGVVFVGI